MSEAMEPTPASDLILRQTEDGNIQPRKPVSWFPG